MAVLHIVGRILAAIVIFGVIVMIHELGHFFAAKLMGVQVNELALGMGPKLIRFQKGETLYSWRLFPIGGFCAMEGEDDAGAGEVHFKPKGGENTADTLPEQPPAAVNPRSFFCKPVWRRAVITVAGVFMNLVLGLVLLIVYFGVCTLPSKDGKVYYSGTQIAVLEETSPSYQTGLRPGDTLQRIDGARVFSVWDMQMLLQDSDDGVFDMTVSRTVDGKRKTVLLKEVTFNRTYSEETGRYTLQYDFYVNAIPQTVGSTLSQSVRTGESFAVMVFRSLKGMVTGKYGLNDLSGPVGTIDIIGDTVSEAVQQTHWQTGLGSILVLVTLLTVNVGIFNLLPLPALDGGRLIFLLWEGITRRPVPQKYEGLVHAIGMGLLLLLIAVITFSDIYKLFI